MAGEACFSSTRTVLGFGASIAATWRYDGAPRADDAGRREDDVVEAGLDVPGRERGAVVELHAAPELELVRLAVRADRPRLGEVGHDLRILEGVELHEQAVERRRRVGNGEGGLLVRVERRRLGEDRVRQLAAGPRCLLRGRRATAIAPPSAARATIRASIRRAFRIEHFIVRLLSFRSGSRPTSRMRRRVASYRAALRAPPRRGGRRPRRPPVRSRGSDSPRRRTAATARWPPPGRTGPRSARRRRDPAADPGGSRSDDPEPPEHVAASATSTGARSITTSSISSVRLPPAPHEIISPNTGSRKADDEHLQAPRRSSRWT